MLLVGYQKRCIVLIIILLVAVIALTSCKKIKVNAVSPFISISPSGDKMAVAVGPCRKEGHVVDLNRCDAYIVDLGGVKSPLFVGVDGKVCSEVFTWRRNNKNGIDELLIKSKTADNDIFMTIVDEKASIKAWYSVDQYPNISGVSSWSPDGQILSGQSSPLPYLTLVGKLAISCDFGKSVVETDVQMYAFKPVWIDNNTFYMQDMHQIFKVSVKNCKPVVRTAVFETKDSKRVYLCGQIDSIAIYIVGNNIYGDSTVIYQSGEKIGPGFVDGSYVAFMVLSGNRKIMIIDSSGNLINEKNVKEDSILVGFVDDFIYLLEDQKYIKKYNINDNTKEFLVFSVDDI